MTKREVAMACREILERQDALRTELPSAWESNEGTTAELDIEGNIRVGVGKNRIWLNYDDACALARWILDLPEGF